MQTQTRPMVAGACQPMEAPQSQITSQFRMLEQILLENDKLVHELESRLHGILRPDVEPNEKDGVPEELFVPLANQLRDLRKVALRTNDAIRSLTSRIEI